MQTTLSDAEIINILSETGNSLTEARKKSNAIESIYKTSFRSVLHLCWKLGASREDAEDLFQEVVIIFFEQVRNKEFVLMNSKISTYIYGLAQTRAIRKFRATKRKFTDLEPINNQAIEEYSENERLLPVLKALNNLNPRCQEILKHFYFDQHSMSQVASQLGYSEGSIRVMKLRCMDKLKQILK